MTVDEGSKGLPCFRISTWPHSELVTIPQIRQNMVTIRGNIKEIQKLLEDLKVEESDPEVKARLHRLLNPDGSGKSAGSDMNLAAVARSNLKLTGKNYDAIMSGFAAGMTTFIETAEAKYTKLDNLFKTAEKDYETAVLLYGEDAKTMFPDEFFGIFSKFVQSFLQAKAENEAALQKEKDEQKKEADKKVLLFPGTFFI